MHSRSIRSRLLAVIAATGFALAACGSDDADPVATPSPPPAPVGAADPGVDAAAPDAQPTPAHLDFVASDVRGGQVVGADYAGGDVVFWFWAPW